ncbi:MAG TPA: tRNA lysidine(34) synthetase TilS [Chitinophagaceae bacterium]|nr:tRNA lysidine(34) synthetase TilS [Chitinophagaceae bacterium]
MNNIILPAAAFKMDLLQEFKNYIQKENLFQAKDKLLLAVSGGVDSVVLCELCKQAGYDFLISHCNFQLRGEESNADEEFVKELAKKYGVKIFSKKFDTEKYAAENSCGIQEAARTLRYQWFEELIGNRQLATGKGQGDNGQLATGKEAIGKVAMGKKAIGKEQTGKEEMGKGASSKVEAANWVLTAHHANDNIETLLMNFFKGTGIKGLLGILPKQNKIIRPLLFARKETLAKFANENALPYREDSSNASDKYTRNYFRNQLIPAVQKVFPQAEDNLAGNLQRFRDIEKLYGQSVLLHKKKLLQYLGKEIHIPVLKLLKAEPISTLVYEIIKDFGFTSHQTDGVIQLLQSGSGKYIQSVTHRIFKNRKWLIITPAQTTLAENILIEENDKVIEFENGKLKMETFPFSGLPLQDANTIASIDLDEVTFPLLLRKWKQGDYFYPLGLNLPGKKSGKKKLSRFFIDQKMSLPQKEKVWVLETGKKIIWVIGKRIDDRFKITAKTKSILRISLD